MPLQPKSRQHPSGCQYEGRDIPDPYHQIRKNFWEGWWLGYVTGAVVGIGCVLLFG
jgi:hypothetical protein